MSSSVGGDTPDKKPRGTALDAARSEHDPRRGPGGRTFHIDVQPATKSAGTAADYHERNRAWRARAEELESHGGRTARELRKLESELPRGAGYTAVIELPYESTPELREAVAERVAQWFEDRGHPAAWAVHHANQDGEYQPHLHLAVLGRHVGRGDDGRARWQRPIDGGRDMRRFRDAVADAVNAEAAEHGVDLGTRWHGGTLRETGITRPPQQRVPGAAYKAQQRREAGEQLSPRAHRAAQAADRIQAHARRVTAANDDARAEAQAEARQERDRVQRARLDDRARLAEQLARAGRKRREEARARQDAEARAETAEAEAGRERQARRVAESAVWEHERQAEARGGARERGRAEAAERARERDRARAAELVRRARRGRDDARRARDPVGDAAREVLDAQRQQAAAHPDTPPPPEATGAAEMGVQILERAGERVPSELRKAREGRSPTGKKRKQPKRSQGRGGQGPKGPAQGG